MKIFLYLFLMWCICLSGKAQSAAAGNYIPLKETGSTKAIADYLTATYTTDLEKLSVVYNWVTTFIRYDKDSMYHINWSSDVGTIAAATLRRRKGVCENYASIFTDILLKCGIPSYVVCGYTNLPGDNKNTGHSWSAVLLDNKWLLCDPTWDIGFSNRFNYFLISPEVFFESHIPFDPLWKLIPPSTFTSADKYYNSVNEQIQNFLQLDSVHQMEASSQRMLNAAHQTEQQKIWQSYVKMQISIVYNEEDMNLYNASVADLNQANLIFNTFVQYRNNQFIPHKSEAEIYNLLEPIYGITTIAKNKLNKMGKVVQNEQYNTELLLLKFAALTERVQEQKKFLKNYFAHSVADRGKLFYK